MNTPFENVALPAKLTAPKSWSCHGAGSVDDSTVKVTGLLFVMLGATVTTRGPVVPPEGTLHEMEVSLHELIVAGTLFRVTRLPACVAPKPVPVITTVVPTGPAAGVIL